MKLRKINKNYFASLLVIVAVVLLISSIIYSTNVKEKLVNEKCINEKLSLDLEELENAKLDLQLKNEKMFSNIELLNMRIIELDQMNLASESNKLDFVNDFKQVNFKTIDRFSKLRHVYGDDIENRINNILDNANIYEPDTQIEYYVCKNQDVYVLNNIFILKKDVSNYIINDKEAILENSTILLKIDGKLFEVRGNQIITYEFSEEGYEIASNVLIEGIMNYKPIIALSPFYSDNVPIIYNNVYIGGVKDIASEYQGYKTGLLFNSQVNIYSFRNDKIQLPMLKGGEKVQVIVNGQVIDENVLPVPYFDKNDTEYVTVDIDVNANQYLAIGSEVDLEIYYPTKVNDTYEIDIDNDRINEVFEWKNNCWILNDDKFVHYFTPLGLDLFMSNNDKPFDGYFVDINNDGILEHVIINETIADFELLEIYDLRFNPTFNPAISYYVRGVN